jgi:hypothetical protein
MLFQRVNWRKAAGIGRKGEAIWIIGQRFVGWRLALAIFACQNEATA